MPHRGGRCVDGDSPGRGDLRVRHLVIAGAALWPPPRWLPPNGQSCGARERRRQDRPPRPSCTQPPNGLSLAESSPRSHPVSHLTDLGQSPLCTAETGRVRAQSAHGASVANFVMERVPQPRRQGRGRSTGRRRLCGRRGGCWADLNLVAGLQCSALHPFFRTLRERRPRRTTRRIGT
jgi:hypothetical protein